MRMHRVSRNTNHFGSDAVKLIEAIREMDQLRRADERKVERIEKQNEPFALVVSELDVLFSVSMFFVDGMLKSGAGCPTFAIVVVFSVAVPVAVAMFVLFLLI